MIVLLTVLSIIGALLLVAVLLYFVAQIITVLDRIGGSADSYLAKLRMGLRAIEVETGHLPTQATQLNGSLESIAAGLQAVDQRLVATAQAAVRQEA